MAIKKSQIYSTLWSACDALRGSMDASQYKDYVLILLFVKYLSDKENDPESMFVIPDGCRFRDFVALKGSSSIGESINKKLEAIKAENIDLLKKLAIPNFNDPNKLGNARQMTDTLSKLIGVFQNADLDFSQNRSADDDILGDAYEYLMKNFAEQSGKSKGQFYTPAEISRVMAKMLHLEEFTSPRTTIYDPTCGSGSLLLRAINETPNSATPFGQEKDNATASLAILNMLLHGMQMATIEQGDTLNHPAFVTGGHLDTFDVCVANPPFSLKSWLGEAGVNDKYHRWNENLCPPAKCGDYAFLLHLIASMKEGTGRGACILPHGVLFRGNAEYDIRRWIIGHGYIEGIVGLPANVFFGTGIPASIILLNKKGAADRKGIFFIDAKDGFMKDGAKNRLREQDVKRIVDTWNARRDVPHYARFVPMEEICDKNDYNLNIPRYISAASTEVQQDIDAHLHGGIPAHDIGQMDSYWEACPTLRDALFQPIAGRQGYYSVAADVAETIDKDASFQSQVADYAEAVSKWEQATLSEMEAYGKDCKPKQAISRWSQSLLGIMLSDSRLVNAYDAYQQLMAYWEDTLQDDCYMVARDGWTPNVYPTKKNATYKELACDLLPVDIVVAGFYAGKDAAIQRLREQSAAKAAEMQQLIADATEDLEDEDDIKAETARVKRTGAYKELDKAKKAIDQASKEKALALTAEVMKKYADLCQHPDEVRSLVIHCKWLPAIRTRLLGLMQAVTHTLTAEVNAVAERYATPLPEIEANIASLESKVYAHLKAMGFE